MMQSRMGSQGEGRGRAAADCTVNAKQYCAGNNSSKNAVLHTEASRAVFGGTDTLQ